MDEARAAQIGKAAEAYAGAKTTAIGACPDAQLERQRHDRRMQEAFSTLCAAREIRKNGILMADIKRWMLEKRQELEATLRDLGV